jgi:hypothetical protein
MKFEDNTGGPQSDKEAQRTLERQAFMAYVMDRGFEHWVPDYADPHRSHVELKLWRRSVLENAVYASWAEYCKPANRKTWDMFVKCARGTRSYWPQLHLREVPMLPDGEPVLVGHWIAMDQWFLDANDRRLAALAGPETRDWRPR